MLTVERIELERVPEHRIGRIGGAEQPLRPAVPLYELD